MSGSCKCKGKESGSVPLLAEALHLCTPPNLVMKSPVKKTVRRGRYCESKYKGVALQHITAFSYLLSAKIWAF